MPMTTSVKATKPLSEGTELAKTKTGNQSGEAKVNPEMEEAVEKTSGGTQVLKTAAKAKAGKRAVAKGNKPSTANAKKPTATKTKKRQKAKSHTTTSAKGVENVIKIGAKMTKNAFKEGAESLQEGFEKLAQDYEKLVGTQKEVAEALVESATIASKGMETINKAVLEYSKTSFEDMFAATKAIVASKSLQEAVEKQSAFTKAAFETYVAEMTKVRELALGTAKAASEPVQKQVDAVASMVKSAAA